MTFPDNPAVSEGARVVVVDDHPLLASSLAAVLTQRGVCAEAFVPQKLDILPSTLANRSPAPALALLDIDLGDIGRSLPVIRPLTERGIKVLMVSGSTDAPEVGACFEAGACGFVGKTRPFDELLSTVQRVLRGEDVLTEHDRLEYLTALWEYRGRQTQRARYFRELTPREEEVLHLLCEGHSVSAIAQSSYVALPTVRSQVRGILTKLGVTTQLEAVAHAYRSGWHIMRSASDEAC